MAKAKINGINIGFDVIGHGSRPWILTPGGRYARDIPGLKELAEGIAQHDASVVIWDRPNCGESDVHFEGDTESDLNADALVGLVDHLGMSNVVMAAGSAGARISLLAEARQPGTASALALWWPSGGAFELFFLGNVYCVPQLRAAYSGGMEEVAALPDWSEQITKNPANRDRLLAQDVNKYIETMERWLTAFIPRDDQVIPGLPDTELAKIDAPAIVFNSDACDANHPKWVSEKLAALLPNARLVDPPWGPREWWDRCEAWARGEGLFAGWPALVPQVTDFVDEVLELKGA